MRNGCRATPFQLSGMPLPCLGVIQWQLCVFRNEDQLLLHKDSLQPIFQMVHYSIAGKQHDFTQSVGLLRPCSWLSCAGYHVLCQVVACNGTIHPQEECLLGNSSLDRLEELPLIQSRPWASSQSSGFLYHQVSLPIHTDA